MTKGNDRRSSEKKPVDVERRKEQRRKNTNISDKTPIRREDDWDKIDSELKDD